MHSSVLERSVPVGDVMPDVADLFDEIINSMPSNSIFGAAYRKANLSAQQEPTVLENTETPEPSITDRAQPVLSPSVIMMSTLDSNSVPQTAGQESTTWRVSAHQIALGGLGFVAALSRKSKTNAAFAVNKSKQLLAADTTPNMGRIRINVLAGAVATLALSSLVGALPISEHLNPTHIANTAEQNADKTAQAPESTIKTHKLEPKATTTTLKHNMPAAQLLPASTSPSQPLRSLAASNAVTTPITNLSNLVIAEQAQKDQAASSSVVTEASTSSTATPHVQESLAISEPLPATEISDVTSVPSPVAEPIPSSTTIPAEAPTTTAKPNAAPVNHAYDAFKAEAEKQPLIDVNTISESHGVVTVMVNSPEVNGIKGGHTQVNISIAVQLAKMFTAAAKDGIRLEGDGFRTLEEQTQKYKQNCGSGTCNPPTAKPGTSMHEKGLAVDYKNSGNHGTAVWKWMNARAAEFGFHNLPSEPWHWSTTGG